MVERCRIDIDTIERLMLADPEMIPLLRQNRALALRALIDAEQSCRIRGRRDMSARMKAKAVRWYGPMYKQLPW